MGQSVSSEEIQKQTEQLDADIAKLKAYKLGMMNPAQFTVNNLDTTAIKKLRIGLFGPTGAGKSSFINTCERVLGQKQFGSCAIQSTASEGTVIFAEYLQDYFFRMVDTKGFFHYKSIRAFVETVEGLVEEGAILPADDKEPSTPQSNKKTNISEQVSVVLFVVGGDDPKLRNSTYRENFANHRQYLRSKGITTICVVTRGDKVGAEKNQVLSDASAATGSPSNQTFLVTNYTKDFCARDIQLESNIVMILHYILTAAEETIRLKMMTERRLYTIETIDVTIISKFDEQKAVFSFTAQTTCGEIMNAIKHKFNIRDVNSCYFTSAQGVVQTNSVPLHTLLPGTQIFLNKYH